MDANVLERFDRHMAKFPDVELIHDLLATYFCEEVIEFEVKEKKLVAFELVHELAKDELMRKEMRKLK